MTKMPFDPAKIAEQITSGGLVYLGEHIVLFKRLNRLVRQCRRCVIEETQSFTPARLIDETEILAKFIFKHQHKDPPS